MSLTGTARGNHATRSRRSWRPRRLTREERRNLRLGLLFVSPWIVGFLVFQFGPMLASLYYSLNDWDSFTPPKWVGLDNYKNLLFHDPIFWKSLWNTFYYAALSVPLGLAIGLWLANLLNKRIRGPKIFRTLIYLPTLVPLVATAMIFKIVLAPSGPFNKGLGLFGVQGPDWLHSETWIKPGLVLLSVWAAGGATVLLLAAMKGIPRELYEAAEVDGAGRLQQARLITWPLLNPITAIVVVLNIVGAMQSYEMVYLMTNGGPNYATNTVGLLSYNLAFGTIGGGSAQYGTAAAMTWTLVIALALAFAGVRVIAWVVRRGQA